MFHLINSDIYDCDFGGFSKAPHVVIYIRWKQWWVNRGDFPKQIDVGGHSGYVGGINDTNPERMGHDE